MGLLVADRQDGALGEGKELVGVGFVVVKVQAGPADAVVDQRVERQGAGVGGSQPRFHQHDDEVTDGGFEQGEVTGGFQLGHDELGHEAGQRLVPSG